VACVLDCGVVRFVGGLNCGTQAICDMKVHSGVYIYIYMIWVLFVERRSLRKIHLGIVGSLN